MRLFPSSVQIEYWLDFMWTAIVLDKVCTCTGVPYPQATGSTIWRQQWVSVLQKRNSKYSYKLWVGARGKHIGELEFCFTLSKILLTHLVYLICLILPLSEPLKRLGKNLFSGDLRLKREVVK